MESNRRRPPDPRKFLPLTHLAYHLLLSLAEAPAHGYALVERIRERSDGLIDPGTGSFYSIVKNLNDARLIEEVEPPGTRHSAFGTRSDRRRTYAITPLGETVLVAETDRLAAQLALTRKLRLAPSGRGGGR
jgi:DNA-binding PadR family transcriptional regulator